MSDSEYSASSNPYLNRVMIRSVRDFYGRKREVARLYARIGAARPQSVAITGERRIGKSSLLWFIMQPENIERYLHDPEQIIFVFLDFQENREMRTEDFCAALLGPLSKRVPDVHPSFWKNLEQKQRHGRVFSDEGYDALLNAAQHLDAQGLKLIVLLDEFETVTQNTNFDGRFYAFLRSLANRYNVAYITSSRLPLQYLCHSRQVADSPFFNIFSSLHLRGFTGEEAHELISIPSRDAGVPLEPYSDFLMDIGGNHPFFLQIACSALFEYLQTGDTLDDVGREEVCENILEDAESHFIYIWDRMEEKEQQVYKTIMEEKPVDLRERGILRNLVRQGYVIETPAGAKLFSSLFARWIVESAPEPEIIKGEYALEAIVVIDICGSTRIANHYGAHHLRSMYQELEGITLEVAGRFRDRYRRTTGDGLLLTFHTVADAVNASLEIQRRVQEHNIAADSPHRIPIRFSIHFGETLTDEEGRRYGDAVNMAFKVESLGVEALDSTDSQMPSEDYLLVTEQVAGELASIPGVRCHELGALELDGLAGLHRIYQLIRD